jgi:hypothetical protein
LECKWTSRNSPRQEPASIGDLATESTEQTSGTPVDLANAPVIPGTLQLDDLALRGAGRTMLAIAVCQNFWIERVGAANSFAWAMAAK